MRCPGYWRRHSRDTDILSGDHGSFLSISQGNIPRARLFIHPIVKFTVKGLVRWLYPFDLTVKRLGRTSPDGYSGSDWWARFWHCHSDCVRRYTWLWYYPNSKYWHTHSLFSFEYLIVLLPSVSLQYFDITPKFPPTLFVMGCAYTMSVCLCCRLGICSDFYNVVKVLKWCLHKTSSETIFI